MKIVYFGTSAFGLPSLEALKNSPHKMLTVVTAPDRPQGRNLRLQPSPVKEWALAHGLPLFEHSKVNSEEFLLALRALGADLFVVISFGVILSKALLEIPRLGSLNVHPSLLPRYRGAAPMQWALLNGDPETGVSIVRINERLDAGDIVLQERTVIGPDEDIVSLEKRLSVLGAGALLKSVGLLEKGRAVFTPQDEKAASHARKLEKEDGHIQWDLPAAQVRDRVRAMKAWPGCYSFYEGKRLLILETEAAGQPAAGARPGTIMAASAAEGIRIAARDEAVEIRTLQAEGRKPLGAREFLNGFPLKAGRALE
ncbi:MAG: methionyl-tRNA formyltransferase [Candidatus Omnitrophota bacterium]